MNKEELDKHLCSVNINSYNIWMALTKEILLSIKQ